MLNCSLIYILTTHIATVAVAPTSSKAVKLGLRNILVSLFCVQGLINFLLLLLLPHVLGSNIIPSYCRLHSSPTKGCGARVPHHRMQARSYPFGEETRGAGAWQRGMAPVVLSGGGDGSKSGRKRDVGRMPWRRCGNPIFAPCVSDGRPVGSIVLQKDCLTDYENR